MIRDNNSTPPGPDVRTSCTLSSRPLLLSLSVMHVYGKGKKKKRKKRKIYFRTKIIQVRVSLYCYCALLKKSKIQSYFRGMRCVLQEINGSARNRCYRSTVVGDKICNDSKLRNRMLAISCLLLKSRMRLISVTISLCVQFCSL